MSQQLRPKLSGAPNRGYRLLAFGCWLPAFVFLLPGCSSDDVARLVARDAIAMTRPTSAPAPTTQAGSAPASDEGSGPLQLGVQKAILLTLQNNRELVVERMRPSIQRTYEEQQEGVFDPVLSATGQYERSRSLKKGNDNEWPVSDISSGSIGLEKFFPTGTTASIDASTSFSDTWTSLYDDRSASSRLGLSVTQALLRGAGIDVNLASLHQAKIDTLVSQYELRAYAESLVAQVEQTYWDYVLAQRKIEIFSKSLDVAQEQYDATKAKVDVGRLAARIELAAAEAEVALRKEALIDANSTLAKTRLLLLRLVNPPGRNLWNREIRSEDQPLAPDVKLDDVESHVQVALRYRPDLNQARLGVQRGDLEIVKTRNGLLPKMDLFITLGKTGYADTFDGSMGNFGGKGYDALVGMSMEYPLGNRDAHAQHQRAVLTRQQSLEAVGNLEQTVQVDVRSAYLEVLRAREQIAATKVSRALQEAKYDAEKIRLQEGAGNSLLVSLAQRDMVASQIDEVQAVTTYLKALVDLYWLQGSLLERRGITAPGKDPVKLEDRGTVRP